MFFVINGFIKEHGVPPTQDEMIRLRYQKKPNRFLDHRQGMALGVALLLIGFIPHRYGWVLALAVGFFILKYFKKKP